MGTNRYRHIVAIIISVVLGWGLMTTVSAQATSEPADDTAYTAIIEQLQQRSSLPAWFSQRPSERTSGATQTAAGVSARSIASKAAPPVCTPMTILTENFEGVGELPTGWTNVTNGAGDDQDTWGDSGGGLPASVSSGGADNAHSGSEWLVFDTSLTANGDDSIVYFPLDLTTVAAPVELSFFLYMYSVGEPPSTFQIDVMRDTNGNGLPDDGAWQNEFFENTDQQTASNQPWVHITRSLNNYVGDKIIMRLRGLENAGATFTSDIEVDLLTITACPANTISGTFSLPPGVVAPAGGVDVQILALVAENGTFNFVGAGGSDITIPAGMNAMSYSLTVPNVPGHFDIVLYTCNSSSCEDLIPRLGFYRPPGVTTAFNDFLPLPSGQNHANIDLAVPAPRTISGTVSLPPGETAAAPIDVSIFAFDGNSALGVLAILFGGAIADVTIPMGGSSVNYTLSAPNVPSAEFTTAFICLGCITASNYVPIGFYRQAGTTYKFSEAQTLAGGQNHSGINITIQRGKQITGTLALPGGQLAPTLLGGNIAITPEFGSGNNLFLFGNAVGLAAASIPMGANASPLYTATVPDDPGQTWVVSYDCFDCKQNGFLGEGFYTTGGSSYQQDEASGLAGGQNHNGVDLKLLPAKIISGMVSLPSGHMANEELEIEVEVIEDRLTPSPWLGPDVYQGYRDSDGFNSIPIGGSNIMYDMVIPDDPAFRGVVRFECQNFSAPPSKCDDWVHTYAPFGFYRSGATTYEIENATRVIGGQNHANINMTLFEGRTISGKLTLPGPAGIGLETALVGDFNHTEPNNTSVRIFEDQMSGPYSIVVPDDASLNFAVGLECTDVLPRKTCSGNARRAFYNSGGMVSLEQDATLLPGGLDHSNIDLSYPSDTFDDIPQNFVFFNDIESLFQLGVTGGCSVSPPNYCPKNPVTRVQMAVFLERFMRPGATLPATSGTLFDDVPLGAFGGKEIELFAKDGITSGCSINPPLYCPNSPITRAQMAVFLLRLLNGAQFSPPPATGMFNDVPTTAFAADWIEELARTGITGGCGNNNFCPNNTVTREQMAAFITRVAIEVGLLPQGSSPFFDD